MSFLNPFNLLKDMTGLRGPALSKAQQKKAVAALTAKLSQAYAGNREKCVLLLENLLLGHPCKVDAVYAREINRQVTKQLEPLYIQNELLKKAGPTRRDRRLIS